MVRSRWPRLLVRLFAFNLLLVFVPILGVLYLGTYETQLLRWQERSMVQQGRLVAAALAAPEPPTAEGAELLLTNLRQRTESRIRILDADALLLADTSLLGPQRDPEAVAQSASPPEREVRERWLYRLGALLVGTYQRFVSRPDPVLDVAEFYASDKKFSGDEVVSALAGRYGAATRGLARWTAIGQSLFSDSDRVRGAGPRCGPRLTIDVSHLGLALRDPPESLQGLSRLPDRGGDLEPDSRRDHRPPGQSAAQPGRHTSRSARSTAR